MLQKTCFITCFYLFLNIYFFTNFGPLNECILQTMEIFDFTLKKSRLAGMLLAIFLAAVCSVAASASYPLVRNYTRSAYHGGTQNWDIKQDSYGRMLFANNSGMLIYDSKNWTLCPIGNYTSVRSLMVDESTSRIYAGGSEEFGYYHNDPDRGCFVYKSLMPTLPKRNHHFTEVWNIHKSGKYIWFQSDFNLLRFDGSKSISIPYKYKITTSALIRGRLYIASKEGGICQLNGKTFTSVPGGEHVKGMRVCALLPYQKGNILIVTEFCGVFIFDGATVRPFEMDIDPFLKANQVFCAATNERKLVFGTVNNGIIIKDITNGSNTFVNMSTGLQNNTVLSIDFDRMDNIWLGLDNGIDYVLYNSPVSTIFGTSNIYGAGYASMLLGNTLLLGTNRGLYATAYPLSAAAEPAKPSSLLKSQVWSIDTLGNDVLVSSDRGLYQLRGSEVRQISGIPGTWAVVPLHRHPDMALASTYESFYLLRRVGGQWTMANRVTGYNEAGGRIIEDEFGNIWISHWMKGIYKLRPNASFTKFDKVELYNHTKGFPTDRNNTLYKIDGELAFSTEGGFFRYNPHTDKMVPNEKLNSIFGEHTSVRLYQSPAKDVWGVSGQYICAAFYNATGTYNVDSITYKPLLDKLIVGFEHFDFISPRKLIVTNEDGFYAIDVDRDHRVSWKSKLFVSNIFATNPDSLIYTAGGALHNNVFDLPYDLNSLRFEFICPEFREEGAVLYSYYLENYDTGWSAYTTANSKEYTQLHEGTYTLHIRSFNRYDDSRSEYSFTFRIAPPWYRSTWAITFYILFIISSTYFLFIYVRGKARKSALMVAKRKEEEMREYKRQTEEESLRRENEISRLKSTQLEHDVRHKSQELSNATMNVMRKNEILIDISNQINKLQESGDTISKTSAKQLMKIQKLIKENISHDDDWHKFAQNFDVVYENYLKRLAERFPQLNINDQRLCAYLKMGLSSKEIAPLLNMSYRSVEMARYRLRKKMELSREVNLVDFLQRL